MNNVVKFNPAVEMSINKANLNGMKVVYGIFNVNGENFCYTIYDGESGFKIGQINQISDKNWIMVSDTAANSYLKKMVKLIYSPIKSNKNKGEHMFRDYVKSHFEFAMQMNYFRGEARVFTNPVEHTLYERVSSQLGFSPIPQKAMFDVLPFDARERMANHIIEQVIDAY